MPSSMARLITKRSMREEPIDRLSETKTRIRHRIKPLQEELAALEAGMPLHEVLADPKGQWGGDSPREWFWPGTAN